MGISAINHIKSALILLFDRTSLPEEAAKILFDGIIRVTKEFYNAECRMHFYRKLKELIIEYEKETG